MRDGAATATVTPCDQLRPAPASSACTSPSLHTKHKQHAHLPCHTASMPTASPARSLLLSLCVLLVCVAAMLQTPSPAPPATPSPTDSTLSDARLRFPLLPRLLSASAAPSSPLLTPSLVSDALVRADFSSNTLQRGTWTAGASSGGSPTGVGAFVVYGPSAQYMNLIGSELIPQWLQGGTQLLISLDPYPTRAASFCFWLRYDGDNAARSGSTLPQAPLLTFTTITNDNRLVISWENHLGAFMHAWRGTQCSFKPARPLLPGQWAQVALVHAPDGRVVLLFNGAQIGGVCTSTPLAISYQWYMSSTLLLAASDTSASNPMTAMAISQFVWWQRAVATHNFTAMYHETTPYLTANSFAFRLLQLETPILWLPPFAGIDVAVTSPLPQFSEAGFVSLSVSSSPPGAVVGPAVLTFVDATLGESVPVQSFRVALAPGVPTATISSSVTDGDVGHLQPFTSFTVNRHESLSSLLSQAVLHVNITASTPRQTWNRFVSSPPNNPLGLGYFHMDGHFQYVDVATLGVGTAPTALPGATGFTIAAWARVHTWIERPSTDPEQPIWAMQRSSNEQQQVFLFVTKANIGFASGPVNLRCTPFLSGRPNPTMQLYSWFHTVVSVGADGTVRLYLNSELVASCAQPLLTLTSATQMYLGRAYRYYGGISPTTADNRLAGAVAGFQMWTRPLNSAEVQWLYANPPANLASASWPLVFLPAPISSLAPGASTDVSLSLPHVYGGAVTLLIETNPPGCAFPSSISWTPSSFLSSYANHTQSFRLQMPAGALPGQTLSVQFQFAGGSDLANYSLPYSFNVGVTSPSLLRSQRSFFLDLSSDRRDPALLDLDPTSYSIGRHPQQGGLWPGANYLWFAAHNPVRGVSGGGFQGDLFHYINLTSARDAGQSSIGAPQDLGPQSPHNTTASVSVVGGGSVMATGWTMSWWLQSMWGSASGQLQTLYHAAHKDSTNWNPFLISISNAGSIVIEMFYSASWQTTARSRCYVQTWTGSVPSAVWLQLTIAQNQRGEFSFWINGEQKTMGGPFVCAPLETHRTASFVAGNPPAAKIEGAWRPGLYGQLGAFSMWPHALTTEEVIAWFDESRPLSLLAPVLHNPSLVPRFMSVGQSVNIAYGWPLGFDESCTLTLQSDQPTAGITPWTYTFSPSATSVSIQLTMLDTSPSTVQVEFLLSGLGCSHATPPPTIRIAKLTDVQSLSSTAVYVNNFPAQPARMGWQRRGATAAGYLVTPGSKGLQYNPLNHTDMGLSSAPAVPFPTRLLSHQPALQSYPRPRAAINGGFTFLFWRRAFSLNPAPPTHAVIDLASDSNNLSKGKISVTFGTTYFSSQIITITWTTEDGSLTCSTDGFLNSLSYPSSRWVSYAFTYDDWGIGSIYQHGVFLAQTECQLSPMAVMDRNAASLLSSLNPDTFISGLNSLHLAQLQYYSRALTGVELASLNTLMPAGPFPLTLSPGPIPFPLSWGPSSLPLSAPAGSTWTIGVQVPLTFGSPSTLYLLSSPTEQLVSPSSIPFFTSSSSDSATKNFVLTLPNDGSASVTVSFVWVGDANIVTPPSFTVAVTSPEMLQSAAIFTLDMRVPPAGFAMPAETSEAIFIAPNDRAETPSNLLSAHATFSGLPTSWLNLSTPERYAQGHVTPFPSVWTRHLSSLDYLRVANSGRGWSVSFWYRAVGKYQSPDVVFSSVRPGASDNLYIQVARTYLRVTVGPSPSSGAIGSWNFIDLRWRWMHFLVQQEPNSEVTVMLYGVSKGSAYLMNTLLAPDVSRSALLGAAPGFTTDPRNQMDVANVAAYARTFAADDARALMLQSPPKGPHMLVLTPAPPNMQPNNHYSDDYFGTTLVQGGSALPWTLAPGSSRTLKVSLPLPLESVLPVTLSITTIPPGCANPTELTWGAAQANNWRAAQADQSFTFNLPVGSSAVQVQFQVSGPNAAQWFAAPLNFTVYASSLEIVQQALVTSATFNLSTFRTGFWRNPSYVALTPSTGYAVVDGAGQTGLLTGRGNAANLTDGNRDAFMWPPSIDSVDRFAAAVPGRSHMALSVRPPRPYALANDHNPTSASMGMGWSWCGWLRLMQLPDSDAQGLWAAMIEGPQGGSLNYVRLQYTRAFIGWTSVYTLQLSVAGSGLSIANTPYTFPLGRWTHLGVTVDSVGGVRFYAQGAVLNGGAPAFILMPRLVSRPLLMAGGDGISSYQGYHVLHLSTMHWYGRMLETNEVAMLSALPPPGPQPLSFLPVAGDALPPTAPVLNAMLPVMRPGTTQRLLITPPWQAPAHFNASNVVLTCTTVPAGLCAPSTLTFSPFLSSPLNLPQELHLTMTANPGLSEVTYTLTPSGDTQNWAPPFDTISIYNLGHTQMAPLQIYRTATFRLSLAAVMQNGWLVPSHSALLGTSQAESNCAWQHVDAASVWDTEWRPMPTSLGGYQVAGWTISVWFTMDSLAMGPRIFHLIDSPATGNMFLQITSAGSIRFYSSFTSLATIDFTVPTATQTSAGAQLQAKQPQHLLVSMDQASVVRLYLNGLIIWTSLQVSSQIFYSPIIGRLTFGGPTGCAQSGRLQLHQVHMWNHSLAALEVAAVASYRFPEFSQTSFSLRDSLLALAADETGLLVVVPNGAYPGICVTLNVTVVSGPVEIRPGFDLSWCSSDEARTVTVAMRSDFTDLGDLPAFTLAFSISHQTAGGNFVAPPPQTFGMGTLIAAREVHTHFTDATPPPDRANREAAISGNSSLQFLSVNHALSADRRQSIDLMSSVHTGPQGNFSYPHPVLDFNAQGFTLSLWLKISFYPSQTPSWLWYCGSSASTPQNRMALQLNTDGTLTYTSHVGTTLQRSCRTAYAWLDRVPTRTFINLVLTSSSRGAVAIFLQGRRIPTTSDCTTHVQTAYVQRPLCLLGNQPGATEFTTEHTSGSFASVDYWPRELTGGQVSVLAWHPPPNIMPERIVAAGLPYGQTFMTQGQTSMFSVSPPQLSLSYQQRVQINMTCSGGSPRWLTFSWLLNDPFNEGVLFPFTYPSAESERRRVVCSFTVDDPVHYYVPDIVIERPPSNVDTLEGIFVVSDPTDDGAHYSLAQPWDPTATEFDVYVRHATVNCSLLAPLTGSTATSRYLVRGTGSQSGRYSPQQWLPMLPGGFGSVGSAANQTDTLWLGEGRTLVILSIEAEDGQTLRNYTVTIFRAYAPYGFDVRVAPAVALTTDPFARDSNGALPAYVLAGARLNFVVQVQSVGAAPNEQGVHLALTQSGDSANAFLSKLTLPYAAGVSGANISFFYTAPPSPFEGLSVIEFAAGGSDFPSATAPAPVRLHVFTRRGFNSSGVPLRIFNEQQLHISYWPLSAPVVGEVTLTVLLRLYSFHDGPVVLVNSTVFNLTFPPGEHGAAPQSLPTIDIQVGRGGYFTLQYALSGPDEFYWAAPPSVNQTIEGVYPPGFWGSPPQPCSCIHGTCDYGLDGTGRCANGSCLGNWAGPDCDVCSGGSFGPDCALCPSCSGHGSCFDGLQGNGTCACDSNWSDAACDACAPGFFSPVCAACPACVHGSCLDGLTNSGECLCEPNWIGPLCAHPFQAHNLSAFTVEDTPLLITLNSTIDPLPTTFVVQSLPRALVAADPRPGSLYQTSDGVTLGALISSVPAAVTDVLNRVIYVPAAGAGLYTSRETHFASFEYTAVTSGPFTSTARGQASIFVQHRNRAPTVTDLSQRSFTATSGSNSSSGAVRLLPDDMRIDDVDALQSALTMFPSVTHGSLSVNRTDMAAPVSSAWSPADLSQSGKHLSFTGPLDALNALLPLLAYTPPVGGMEGTDTFALFVSDNGNTGFGTYLTAITSQVLRIVPPPPPPVLLPTAVLIAPSQVGACEVFRLDGSMSAAVDGVAPLHFTWRLVSVKLASGLEVLDASSPSYLASLAAQVGSFPSQLGADLGWFGSDIAGPDGSSSNGPHVVVPATRMIRNATYRFELAVDDLLTGTGALASASVMALAVAPGAAWLPHVSIVLPPLTSRMLPTTLQVAVTPNSCEPLPSDLTLAYEWLVEISSNSSVVAVSPPLAQIAYVKYRLTGHAPSLTLPAYHLYAGYTYTATLRLTMSSASAMHAGASRRLLSVVSVVETSATFTAPLEALQAHISQSDFTHPLNLPLLLDGSTSFDPNYERMLVSQPQFPFTFLWTCATSDGAVCALPVHTALNESRLLIPGDVASVAFVAGVEYSWTLSVRSLFDSRTASSAAVRVTTTPSTRANYPSVSIERPVGALSSNQPVWLRGILTPPTDGATAAVYEYMWTCDKPGLDLTDAAFNLGTPNSLTLGVAGELLGAGPRRFTLTVVDRSATDAMTELSVFSSASRTVDIVSPPAGGTCSVTPSGGGTESLATLFRVHCSGWVDPSSSGATLTYALASVDSASTCTHSPTPLVHSSPAPQLSDVLLPQGNSTLLVTIRSPSSGTATEVRLSLPPVSGPSNLTHALDPSTMVRDLTPTLLAPLLQGDQPFGAFSMVARLAAVLNADAEKDSRPGNMQQRSLLLRSLLQVSIQSASAADAEVSQASAAALKALTCGPLPAADAGSLTQIIGGSNPSDLDAAAQLLDALASAVQANMSCALFESSLSTMSSLLRSQVMAAAAVDNFAPIRRTNGMVDATAAQVLTPALGSALALPGALATHPNLAIQLLSNGPRPSGSSHSVTSVVSQISPFYAVCFNAPVNMVGAMIRPAVSLNGLPVNASAARIPVPVDPFQLSVEVQQEKRRLAIVCPRHPMLLPSASNDDDSVAEGLLACQWYDRSSQRWSSQGCELVDFQLGFGQCECPPAVSRGGLVTLVSLAGTAVLPVCADASGSDLGAWFWLLLAIMYMLVFLFACAQLFRMGRAHGLQPMWSGDGGGLAALSILHVLVGAASLWRGVAMLIHYRFYRAMSPPLQSVLANAAFLFLPWIFSYLLHVWSTMRTMMARMRAQRLKAAGPDLEGETLKQRGSSSAVAGATVHPSRDGDEGESDVASSAAFAVGRKRTKSSAVNPLHRGRLPRQNTSMRLTDQGNTSSSGSSSTLVPVTAPTQVAAPPTAKKAWGATKQNKNGVGMDRSERDATAVLPPPPPSNGVRLLLLNVLVSIALVYLYGSMSQTSSGDALVQLQQAAFAVLAVVLGLLAAALLRKSTQLFVLDHQEQQRQQQSSGVNRAKVSPVMEGINRRKRHRSIQFAVAFVVLLSTCAILSLVQLSAGSALLPRPLGFHLSYLSCDWLLLLLVLLLFFRTVQDVLEDGLASGRGSGAARQYSYTRSRPLWQLSPFDALLTVQEDEHEGEEEEEESTQEEEEEEESAHMSAHADADAVTAAPDTDQAAALQASLIHLPPSPRVHEDPAALRRRQRLWARLRGHVQTMKGRSPMRLGGADGCTPMLADGVTCLSAVVTVAARQNKWILYNHPIDDDSAPPQLARPVSPAPAPAPAPAPLRADPNRSKRMWARLRNQVLQPKDGSMRLAQDGTPMLSEGVREMAATVVTAVRNHQWLILQEPTSEPQPARLARPPAKAKPSAAAQASAAAAAAAARSAQRRAHMWIVPTGPEALHPLPVTAGHVVSGASHKIKLPAIVTERGQAVAPALPPLQSPSQQHGRRLTQRVVHPRARPSPHRVSSLLATPLSPAALTFDLGSPSGTFGAPAAPGASPSPLSFHLPPTSAPDQGDCTPHADAMPGFVDAAPPMLALPTPALRSPSPRQSMRVEMELDAPDGGSANLLAATSLDSSSCAPLSASPPLPSSSPPADRGALVSASLRRASSRRLLSSPTLASQTHPALKRSTTWTAAAAAAAVAGAGANIGAGAGSLVSAAGRSPSAIPISPLGDRSPPAQRPLSYGRHRLTHSHSFVDSPLLVAPSTSGSPSMRPASMTLAAAGHHVMGPAPLSASAGHANGKAALLASGAVSSSPGSSSSFSSASKSLGFGSSTASQR